MSHISFSLKKKPGNAPLKSPTAYQLRALVLDYLCHQCFTNTARAFLHDSTVKELDADGDEVLPSDDDAPEASSSGVAKVSPQALLKNVQQRQEIRQLILAGRVDDAMELLNQHFPLVLKHDIPISNESSSGDIDVVSFTYASETSMVPAHLLLNLRVQAFIEACRTRPLEIPQRKPTQSAPSAPDTSLGIPMDISDDSFNTPSPHPSSSSARPRTRSSKEPQYSEITPARLEALLHKGQKLYALAAGLPNSKDKDVYQKELANVGGLLAYPVPEESPVSRYLSYERREALADQINRAILYRSGRPPISDIELLVRYTTALWHSAQSYGARVRSGACIPPTPSKSTTPVAGSKPDDAVNEEVPAFDLRQFLDFKP